RIHLHVNPMVFELAIDFFGMIDVDGANDDDCPRRKASILQPSGSLHCDLMRRAKRTGRMCFGLAKCLIGQNGQAPSSTFPWGVEATSVVVHYLRPVEA